MSAPLPQLFQPIKVGTSTLQHRVVLAPLTRFRASKKEHVPVVPLVEKYYAQRASVPGSLLISEATFIAPRAGGFDNVPGIWSSEQIAAWKQITDQVHRKKSFIYLQLWAIGRAATPRVLREDGHDYVAPSPVGIHPNEAPPRALTTAEIREYVDLYVRAARNAVELAGFDGVEVHSANGYLLHQFLEDRSNQRTDEYGGSVDNRSRFSLEVVKAISEAIGERRTAIRLSPWNRFQDMKMDDPFPQYTHIVTALKERHPNLAYLHVVEPSFDRLTPEEATIESNDFIRKIWAPRPLVSTLGYDPASALSRAERNPNELIGFGKWYISNPDLPTRILKNIALTPYNPKGFYTAAESPDASIGYADYPTAETTCEVRPQL